MTIKIATAAALLLMLPASALAQTTTTPAVTPPAAAAKCPTPGTVKEADLPPECKTQSGAAVQQPAAGAAATTAPADTTTTGSLSTAPATPKPASGVNAASVSSGNTILASDFIGQTVYTSTGDNVGDISDLVMNRDLSNILAVVGVGGFLGIGKKDVAIALKDITVTKDADKRLHLTINMTKAQLDAAQSFDRTALR